MSRRHSVSLRSEVWVSVWVCSASRELGLRALNLGEFRVWGALCAAPFSVGDFFANHTPRGSENFRLQGRRQTTITMEEFQVPEDMGDPRALQVQTAGRFCASQDLPSLKDETTERLNDILDSVGSRLAHGEVDALSEQDNFDDLYSLVRSVCARFCGVVLCCFWCRCLQGRKHTHTHVIIAVMTTTTWRGVDQRARRID